MVDVIKSSEFEDKVLKASGPVLVDLYADWCPPCRALTPELEKLAEAMKGRLSIVKIDTDTLARDGSDPVFNVMREKGIRSIPTLLLYDNGTLIDMRVGSASAAELQRWVDRKGGAPEVKPPQP